MELTLLPLDEPKQVELIKHTAAIHIKTSLSLVDRKVLNILLKNAYDELGKVKYHTIRLAQIKHWVGWNSKNYDDLKRSLRKLVNTKIEWNILGQDKRNKWFISSLLASASIAGGKCTYDYPFHLQELLKNPNIYGKINLLSQNYFKSKYSLILWEFLMNHISNTKSTTTGTGWIKIKDYRDLMGVEDKVYTLFKEFSYNLVRNPIKEINQVSEILVEVNYQKEGDKFNFIRFLITKKPKENIAIKNTTESDTEIQKTLKETLLNFCKLSPASADQILDKYDAKQLVANIKYIESEHKKGIIKNISSYSVNAIKNDFKLGEIDKKTEQKKDPKEIKILRDNLKRAFAHHRLDYDIYLNGNDIKQLEDGFLIYVSERGKEFLKTKYNNIFKKFKINLEIKSYG